LSILYNAVRYFLANGEPLPWKQSGGAGGELYYAQLLSSSYVPDPTQYSRANLPAGITLTPPVALTGISIDPIGSGGVILPTTGICTAANVDFGVITVGPVGGVLITLQAAPAAASTDLLYLYLDEGTGFGYPINNLDCQIVWDATGIWAP
jgi:hypothetical protein